MNKRDGFELGVFLAFLIASIGVGGSLLTRGLYEENRLTAKRLERAFAPLLRKAHHAKDDLSLQEAVSALAQAPGIGFACVLDAEDKAIAHSRLDQLGKGFELPRDSARIMNVPLKDGSARWGTFIFSLSTRSTERLRQKMGAVALGWVGILVAGFVVHLLIVARQRRQWDQQIQDEITLRLEKEEANKRLEQRLTIHQEETQALIACALERVPQPAVLLDRRQRVAGVNPAAALALGILPGTTVLGKSWQDMTVLADQGATIEQSLGQPVLFELESAGELTPRPVLRACR